MNPSPHGGGGSGKGRWFCKIEVATPVYAWTRRTANQVSGNSGTITHPHRGGVFRVQTTTVQCSTRTSVGRCAWVTFSESRGGLGHRDIDAVLYVRILRRKRAVACTKSRSQSRSVSGERLAIVLLFLLVSILVHNCNPRRCVRLSAFVLRPLGPLGYGSQERQGHARLRKRVPGTSSLLTNRGRKRKEDPPTFVAAVAMEGPWYDPTAACPASAKGFSAPESKFGQSGSRLGILPTGIGPAWNLRLKANANVINIDAQSVKSVLCDSLA
eukprot:CAMPEP_0119471860 /NCGR_PEP_ID=MMETSP1344-20130328/4154_1 /TAXON_ID=236787 /ORGANISM="Florenciella parvula, Strain CCMP2471" /LENGTH=269 /DNA_ID=CAMNT_0007504707 /DNA_START=203 /DNA_END=1009 /DNA_ORIENTATION=-